MNRPSPISAAGWISMPVTARLAHASVPGTSGTPARATTGATRWRGSACTPGHSASTSVEPTPRAEGSRACTAATSRRTSPTTRARVRRPSIGRKGRPCSAALRRCEERRRHVALAGVGQDRDDPLAGALRPAGDLERAPYRRAAGHPRQDALAPGELPGRRDRDLVGALQDLVEDLAVEDRRHEARAD